MQDDYFWQIREHSLTSALGCAAGLEELELQLTGRLQLLERRQIQS